MAPDIPFRFESHIELEEIVGELALELDDGPHAAVGARVRHRRAISSGHRGEQEGGQRLLQPFLDLDRLLLLPLVLCPLFPSSECLPMSELV